MIKLDITMQVKVRRRIELVQTLNSLKESMAEHGLIVEIEQSGDGDTFNFQTSWQGIEQMRSALPHDDFKILAGAIAVLCTKHSIRINDELIQEDLAKLTTLKINEIQFSGKKVYK
jgi:hypothetical protein